MSDNNLVLRRSDVPATSRQTLLPGILVMNHKYFPESSIEAPKNGDTAFVMSVILVLKRLGVFCGMILYKKDEKANTPSVLYDIRNRMPCAIVSFRPKTDPKFIQEIVSRASERLAFDARLSPSTKPILYHQDETFVGSHPHHLPMCITHHVPIYKDYVRHFPRDDALVAFGGNTKDEEKVKKLCRGQDIGVSELLSRPNAFVLKMSDIQGNHFKRCGVHPSKILSISPPIHSIIAEGLTSLTTKPPPFKQTPHRIHQNFVFTAAARLGHFKNIEILLDAAVILIRQNVPVLLLIAGDEDDTAGECRRAALLKRVPALYRHHIEIIPKLSKPELYGLFTSPLVHAKGIFACSSRYETLAITPLEAAMNGVTTIIQDNAQHVEAARYFPRKYRFANTPEGLAAHLSGLFRQDLRACGRVLKRHVERDIPEGKFECDLEHAWRECSRSVLGDA